MKLYDVPPNSKIKLLNEGRTPPDCQGLEEGMELDFKHIDGMYSLCYTKHGEMVHLVAWSEVDIVETA